MKTSEQDRTGEADRATIAKIDAAGWGVFFIWIGVALFADVGWGIALLGTGVIALGSQVARRALGLAIDPWGIGFGACLAVAGLVQWMHIPLHETLTWFFPAAFMALGIGILVATWARHRH